MQMGCNEIIQKKKEMLILFKNREHGICETWSLEAAGYTGVLGCLYRSQVRAFA